MRCPRVRIHLGGLAFWIAVVAVELAAFRAVFLWIEQSKYLADFSEWRAELIGLAGLFPLASAAGIGLARRAIRRVRRWRSSGEGSPRPSPPGFTFLALHLLALAWMVVAFLPDVVTGYWRFLVLGDLFETVTSFIDSWSYDGRVVFYQIFMYSALFVAISGPPLAVAAGGWWLARRLARTMPRWRFRALGVGASLGFAGIILAIGTEPGRSTKTGTCPSNSGSWMSRVGRFARRSSGLSMRSRRCGTPRRTSPARTAGLA